MVHANEGAYLKGRITENYHSLNKVAIRKLHPYLNRTIKTNDRFSAAVILISNSPRMFGVKCGQPDSTRDLSLKNEPAGRENL